MPKTSKGLTDCLPDNERITSRWHVCKPVRVFYDDGSDEDYGMRPTCNPDLSFCSGYEVVYGKGEHGMLKQWEGNEHLSKKHKIWTQKGAKLDSQDSLRRNHPEKLCRSLIKATMVITTIMA
nr:hypothetical protein [Tanacetum cinerariifolium]